MAPRLAAALGLLALLLAGAAAQRNPDWTWRQGRATHYGGPSDAWFIHKGSCQYYYLDPGVATGWDICAPADANWDFDGGSCGACYEVACDANSITDGYGNTLDRSSVCYDTGASVVVMVTDVCPCHYPENQYSNKRWCCGPSFHLDMSVYAFEKLADKKWGVISIKYRRVSCDYTPSNVAALPPGVSPTPAESSAPWGWSPDKDRRPRFTNSLISNSAGVMRAQTSAFSNAGSGNRPNQPAASPNQPPSAPAAAGGGDIYNSGLTSGWSDWSFSSRKWDAGSSKGASGGTAYCTTVSAGGGVSFNGWKGALKNAKVLEVLLKKNSFGTPDFTVQLFSATGTSRPVSIPQVSWVQGVGSDWLRLSVPLNAFSWTAPDWSSNASPFKGCGSAGMGVDDVSGVQFKNNRGQDQWLCLDKLRTT